MHLACNALDGGLPGQARQIVDRHRPKIPALSSNATNANMDLRGWEWRHLWEHTRPVELFTLVKQNIGIHSMALSPGDNPLLASVDSEHLNVWDFKKRDKLRSLPMPLRGRGIMFSPDGKWLACGGNEVRIWDTATWILQKHTPLSEMVAELAFSPDSRLLAGASQKRVRIWSVPTFDEMAELPAFYSFDPGAIACGLAFSPDGRTIAYGITNSFIQLWDTVSKSPTVRLPSHSASVNTLCFSPDGRTLASGTQPDNCVRVYDLSAPEACKELLLDGKYPLITRIRFSPDGKRLAAGSENGIRMFNTATWKEITTYRGCIWDMDFSSDGKWLASSSADGQIQIWKGEPTTPEPEQKAIPTDVKWSALSPGGETLLTIYTNNTFSLWRTATLQEGERQPYPGAIIKAVYFDWIPFGAAVAPGGRRIAYVRGDGVLAVWDVTAQREIATMAPRIKDIDCIRFSPDGNTLAFSCDEGGEAAVWDIGAKTNCFSFRMQGVILSFDFSQDGMQLAAGAVDSDSFGEIWNLPQQRRVAQLAPKQSNSRRVVQIALSHDGRLAATVEYGGDLKLWDLRTQNAIWSLADELYGFHSMSFSADDSRLATLSLSKGTLSVTGRSGALKVIDTQTKAEVASLQAQPGLVAFLSDGNTLITLHKDATLLRRFRAAPFSDTDTVDVNKTGNSK